MCCLGPAGDVLLLTPARGSQIALERCGECPPQCSPLPVSRTPPYAHPSVESMWCDTAQCLALPPQKWVRAGLCPEAQGHGFSSGMSLSKATRATILPPLPVAQGAPACSALLKKGTKPPQTPIVVPLHAPGMAGTPTVWLSPAMPGSGAQLADGQQQRVHMEGRNNLAASTAIPPQPDCPRAGAWRAQVCLQPSAWPAQEGCGVAGLWSPGIRPSPAPTTARHGLPAPRQEPHTSATAHSGLATPLCHVCPPSEPSPRSTGTAWLEPPCSCQ